MGSTASPAGGDAAQHEEPLRTLDTHHLFIAPATRAEWEARRRELRQQVLFSAGLWPMPDKTPLHPRVTGRIEGPDYVIENVAIETLPGFYLCGNLYLPKGKRGPFPGIVNPHGHWEQGRLTMEPDVPKAAPPPANPAPGRGNLVAIGVNMARQGFVVFAYDMVGYNDTVQISNHRTFGNSPRAWLWGASLAGLQLWNSIRAVDYLCSLKEVDSHRIGATGASGGGTQTFLLTAVDDRIAVSVPVNMVCAYMQGGCLCENGPGLRVGTDNVEIAALFAPKPQLLVAATGDWTSHVPTEEWPALRKVYDLYGAADKTACVQFNYEHNFNVESREAMYAWFGRWFLRDTNAEHFRERPFEVDVSKMRVWNADHPMPKDALSEAAVEHALIDRSEHQLAAAWPHDRDGLKHFRDTYRPALSQSLSVDLGPAFFGSNSPRVLIVYPPEYEKQAEAISLQLLKVKGLAANLRPLASSPFRAPGNWGAFPDCYNQSALGTAVQVVRDLARTDDQMDVVGLGSAGPVVLLARALTDVHGRTVVDMEGFDAANDQAFVQGLYAPGLRRAGDLRSAAMLCAPNGLCLFNMGPRLNTDNLAAGFRAAHAPLRVERGPMGPEQIVAWLHLGPLE